jgi:hypothetical protein
MLITYTYPPHDEAMYMYAMEAYVQSRRRPVLEEGDLGLRIWGLYVQSVVV